MLLYPQAMQNGNHPHIDGIALENRNRALQLLFRHFPAEERRRQIDNLLADPVAASSLGLGGLLGAYRQGKLVGVVFSQPRPDKTAIVWLPRLMDNEPVSTADALLQATWRFLETQQIALAQTLLPTVGPSEERVLRTGGLHRLANLFYLVALPPCFPNAEPTSDLHFETYTELAHDRLVGVVEATYEGTQDCPELKDRMSGENALAGYRASGTMMPDLWRIVRHDARDVGCLLLADHSDYDTVELQYFGLVPHMRHRGLGRQMLRYALWRTRIAGRGRLALAVDAANKPALQTYMGAGFEAWQERFVYVRRAPFVDDRHTSFRQVIHSAHPAEREPFSAKN